MSWAGIERAAAGARLELVGELLELGRAVVPVVERGLQRRRDVVRGMRAPQIARDDDEDAVAGSVLERSELHREVSNEKP